MNTLQSVAQASESVAPRQTTPRYGVVSTAELTAVSGLEFLRGIMDGRYPAPPIAETCAFEPIAVEHGFVAFDAQPGPLYLNPLGTVHGGWSSTLLDTVMACAVHSTLKPGQGYTTLEFKIHFVRPILATAGKVRAEGKLIHGGGRVATSEGRILDEKGRVLAHGTETCLVFDVPKT